MTRFISARFSRVLDAGECAAFAHGIVAGGASLAAWKVAAGAPRTYLLLEASGELAAPGEAVLHDPAIEAFEITCEAASARIMAALCGAGRPLAAVATLPTATSAIVEWDPRVAPASLLVDLVDAEAGGTARRIEPLLPLGDATLAELAAQRLRARFDAGRILEPYAVAARQGGAG